MVGLRVADRGSSGWLHTLHGLGDVPVDNNRKSKITEAKVKIIQKELEGKIKMAVETVMRK